MASDNSIMADKHYQGFLHSLPSEVIDIILSHLDQRDSLACLVVCRDWYNLIPQYMENVWETLIFYTSDYNIFPYPPFAKYVKTIKFNQCTLYTIMKRLVDTGCTAIETIELTRCYTVKEKLFLSLLKQLAPGLIRLQIKEHMSNVPLNQLLGVPPKLTHFTYDAYDTHRVHDPELTVDHLEPVHEYPNLSYLRMDALLDKRLQLEPILKKCPNLRVFIGFSSRTFYKSRLHDVPYADNAIDFDTLLSSCPKLTHFAANSSYSSIEKLQEYNWHIEATKTVERRSGIRAIFMCDEYCNSNQQATSMLARCQDTLQDLSLSKGNKAGLPASRILNWSLILDSVRMPYLRTFICGEGIQIDATAVVTLLNNSPLMDTLVLYCRRGFLVFDTSVIQQLQIAKVLHTLKCEYMQVGDGFDPAAFLDRFPALENLFIYESPIVLNLPHTIHRLKHLKQLNLHHVELEWTDGCTSDTLINSKLESVTLCDRGDIGYEMLSLFAPIPTLKHLSVVFDATPWINDADGLHRFAEAINGKYLESLRLYGIRKVPFILLEKLAGLSNFRTLEINGPHDDGFGAGLVSVPMLGLLRLLEKSTSLEKLSYKTLVLEEAQKAYTRNEVMALLKQKVPRYRFEATSLGNEQSPDEVLYNVYISAK